VAGRSPVAAGVQLTRDGLVTFDKVKFESAYAADPAAAAAIFYGAAGSEGIAQRLAAVSLSATKSTTGMISAAIDTRRADIKRIDDSIALWDVRLVRKEAVLRKQFAALEGALGAAQQQGNWLAGQIASLPKAASS
jgi:flagellar hook-associated protein 2